MSEPTWTEVAGTELDPVTLYAVLRLRSAVFVVEQDCAYQDVDGLDLLDGVVHVLAREGERISAYARVLPPGAGHDTPRVGRVIVDPGARGQQLGRRLVQRALATCAARWPDRAVELGGQAHLTGFYGSLGFVAVGEPYDEDGIAHVWMRREAERAG